jgi:serine/threonine protein kinase
MLDGDNNLIMVDFGESSRFLEEDDVLGGIKGTLLYRAPEYYLNGYSANKTINLRPVDIWAAGASLYHLATGKLPFPVKEFIDYKNYVNEGTIDYSMFSNDE